MKIFLPSENNAFKLNRTGKIVWKVDLRYVGYYKRRCTLREKCQNTEFFLVRIFLYWDWIGRDTEYLSVFSPNTEKYGPEVTPYLDTFHVVDIINGILKLIWRMLK